jgi:hypothetical protein
MSTPGTSAAGDTAAVAPSLPAATAHAATRRPALGNRRHMRNRRAHEFSVRLWRRRPPKTASALGQQRLGPKVTAEARPLPRASVHHSHGARTSLVAATGPVVSSYRRTAAGFLSKQGHNSISGFHRLVGRAVRCGSRSRVGAASASVSSCPWKNCAMSDWDIETLIAGAFGEDPERAQRYASELSALGVDQARAESLSRMCPDVLATDGSLSAAAAHGCLSLPHRAARASS